MKKNKLLLLIGLFPLLMSNSAAPIPYIAHNPHYSNFSINSITKYVEEGEIEDEEPPENNEKEDENTPSEPIEKENYLYTFNITNHGSYVIDSTITFIIDKKYEVTFGEDYLLPSKDEFYILPSETKDITFDFTDYSYIFTEGFDFTIYSVTGREANAHRYRELDVSNYEIVNRIVAYDSSSTTFKIRYELEEEPWDLFVGLNVRYSDNDTITSKYFSDPEATVSSNYLTAQFTLDGVKNSADIKSVDATIYLDANITSSYRLTDLGKAIIITLITILSILIVFGLISLIIGLSSSKREKEIYNKRKFEEEEFERTLKEEKERLKNEKKAKKEEEKRLKKEEKDRLKEEREKIKEEKKNLKNKESSISTLNNESSSAIEKKNEESSISNDDIKENNPSLNENNDSSISETISSNEEENKEESPSERAKRLFNK